MGLAQLIEQLMREIMNYDAEFRREYAAGEIGSHARHRQRPTTSCPSTPPPMLDRRPPSHVRKRVWCLSPQENRLSRRSVSLCSDLFI